jgi:hypothetical protein
MNDTTPTEPFPTVQDRAVVFQITSLDLYPKPQEEEFRRWVEDGKFVISDSWTQMLNAEALRVAAIRRVLETQIAAAKGEAQHYQAELNECQEALDRALSEREDARAKLVVARKIISAAAAIVDPECPDLGAYEDGHCDLAISVECLALRPQLVEVTDEEWRQLQWAGTRRVDGEPALYQLNEILAKRTVEPQRLEIAYKVVEQDLIRCGVSSIVHKTTPQREHMSWGARVFSELRTVELPEDASLYEVINGPMACAYRARGYDFSMTAAEREAQRRSFVFGNAAIDNPDVTRELVDRAADEMKQDKERGDE